jgi:hypothetical protein
MRVSTKSYQNLMRDSFPGTLLGLLAFLKRKNKRLQRVPRWRVRQVQNFAKALNATAFELERARRERRMTTLAWSARNFLELSIWIEYCCASEGNARRFTGDTGRDLFGMIAAGKQADITPEQHEKVNEVLQRLERILNTQSFKVSDEYKKVSKAATELGREREFFSLNKLFSKIAHPTAFVVNSRFNEKFQKHLRAAIFIQGASLALTSMVKLIDFFMANSPDAHFRHRSE